MFDLPYPLERRVAANGIHTRIPDVAVPVLVVRAMQPPTTRELMDFRYSPTWPELATHFRHSRDLHLPDRTDFIPMQDPAPAAQWIAGNSRPEA